MDARQTARSPACPFDLQALDDVDPFAAYASARQAGPVVWDEGMQAWLALDFDVCVHIETHEDQFASPYRDAPPLVVKIKGGGSNIAIVHGDQHKRLRRFHQELLSPRAVETYRRNQVRPIIGYLIDRIAGAGRAELVADIADQLPPRVIASLFGMPWRDDDLIARILHLHEEVMLWIGRKNAGEPFTSRAMAASEELNAMLLTYIRAARERPSDDFCSRVWREAPQHYGVMDEEIALGICREIFLGGSDTTVHGIANCLYLMLTRPDLRATAEADRKGALTGLVEEAMRLYGSVQYRFRIVQSDCELGGAMVKAGEAVVLLHGAANRDPARFERPDEPDLGRRPIADHLTFNKGPRTCVGAGLARVEMRDVLEAVFDRLPNARLDPDAEPPRFRSLFMRSFRPLHVLL